MSKLFIGFYNDILKRNYIYALDFILEQYFILVKVLYKLLYYYYYYYSNSGPNLYE